MHILFLLNFCSKIESNIILYKYINKSSVIHSALTAGSSLPAAKYRTFLNNCLPGSVIIRPKQRQQCYMPVEYKIILFVIEVNRITGLVWLKASGNLSKHAVLHVAHK